MNKFSKLTLFTFIICSSLILSADTTSNIRGKVVNSSGDSVSNADIVLTYGPTNTSQSVSSNSDGSFAMLNLQLGGPYRISANAGSVSGSLNDLYLVLGKDSQVTITVGDASNG